MPAQDKEFCHKELKLLAKIESEFVVRYITSWKESENFLFIQMELCSSTLKEVIFKKKQEFNRNGREAMNITEFYISNELFKEIVEGINYLHNLETPIIHRDLKPQNLLITSGINGRFIKIADFGLATFHDSNEQSHTKNMGTVKYCALEVQNGRNYNTKADIYSLGVLAQDLFDVDIYSLVFKISSYFEFHFLFFLSFIRLSGLTVFENLIFKSKFECLVKWIIAMNSTQSGMRPSCSKLIENMNSWTLSRDELESDPEFEKFRDLSQDIESIERNFIQYYFTKTWMKTSKEELTHL
jgi:serine/threonine protein kinase